MSYAVIGNGKTGSRVAYVLEQQGKDFGVVTRGVWKDSYNLVQFFDHIDSAIVFVSPGSGYEVTRNLLERGIDTAVGTTKFYLNPDGSENQNMLDEFRKLTERSGKRMIYASNFSVGMNAFWRQLK